MFNRIQGQDVIGFKAGDEVCGVTNPQFCSSQAEFAVASAEMIVPKPQILTQIQAAWAPVIAVAAWQMLFEFALAKPPEVVMIPRAADNVGAYAVQMTLNAGSRVVAVARPQQVELFHSVGVR